jgi:hypothetical protein
LGPASSLGGRASLSGGEMRSQKKAAATSPAAAAKLHPLRVRPGGVLSISFMSFSGELIVVEDGEFLRVPKYIIAEMPHHSRQRRPSWRVSRSRHRSSSPACETAAAPRTPSRPWHAAASGSRALGAELAAQPRDLIAYPVELRGSPSDDKSRATRFHGRRSIALYGAFPSTKPDTTSAGMLRPDWASDRQGHSFG